MTANNPKWVFRCEFGELTGDWNTTSWRADDYYWNATSSKVVWFASYAIDYGSFWQCVLYPTGIGACNM
jgi:hypothetical protein